MSGTKRSVVLAAGIAIVVLGLLTAGGLWYAAGQRLDDNVAEFARAPSGCATTLDFDRTGQFTLYLETDGRIDDIAGDCGAEADFEGADVTNPSLTLVDMDGAPVTIEPADGVSYDTGTFAGSSAGIVDISRPGEHVLTVAEDDQVFAIAVGGDPGRGVAALRWGAVLVAVASLIVGGVLLVVGSRKPPIPADGRSLPGPTDWPTAPPGFPTLPPTTGTGSPSPVTPNVPPPPTGPTGPPGWGPPTIQ